MESEGLAVYSYDLSTNRIYKIAHGYWPETWRNDYNGIRDLLPEIGVQTPDLSVRHHHYEDDWNLYSTTYTYKIFVDNDPTKIVVFNPEKEVKIVSTYNFGSSTQVNIFENPQFTWTVLIYCDEKSGSFKKFRVPIASGFEPDRTLYPRIADEEQSVEERSYYLELLSNTESNPELEGLLENLLESDNISILNSTLKTAKELKIRLNMDRVFEFFDQNGFSYRDLQITAAEYILEVAEDQDVENVLQHMNDQGISIKAKLIRTLGRIGGEEVLETLNGYLRDYNRDIREAAFEALENRKDSADTLIAELRSNLNSSDAEKLISALGETGDSRTISILREVIEKGDPSLYLTALWEMEGLAEPEDISLLIDLCSRTTEERVIHKAFSILGDIGDLETMEFLLEKMSETTRHWQNASSAIQKIIIRDQDLARNFFDRLGGFNRDQKHIVYNAILLMYFPSIKDVFKDGLIHTNISSRSNIAYSIHTFAAHYRFSHTPCDDEPLADDMLQLLEIAMQDSNRRVRLAAAESLGWLVRKDVVPLLEQLLEDPVLAVRIKADESLNRINSFLTD